MCNGAMKIKFNKDSKSIGATALRMISPASINPHIPAMAKRKEKKRTPHQSSSEWMPRLPFGYFDWV